MSNIVKNDKDILGGLSVFRGTRVPIRNLFDYLLAGESVKDFLKDFPTVSFEQVSKIIKPASIIHIPL